MKLGASRASCRVVTSTNSYSRSMIIPPCVVHRFVSRDAGSRERFRHGTEMMCLKPVKPSAGEAKAPHQLGAGRPLGRLARDAHADQFVDPGLDLPPPGQVDGALALQMG